MKSSKVNPEQLGMMRNALGLLYKKEPYRNYFMAYKGSENEKQWNNLVRKGLAEREAHGKSIYFYLTDEGQAVALA